MLVLVLLVLPLLVALQHTDFLYTLDMVSLLLVFLESLLLLLISADCAYWCIFVTVWWYWWSIPMLVTFFTVCDSRNITVVFKSMIDIFASIVPLDTF
jgi:hypothetical protein